MTKMRKIEILELLKKEMQKPNCECLCEARIYLYWYSKTNEEENNFVRDLIRDNKPKKAPVYWYKPYLKAPRIKWINARIKELQ